MAGWTIPRLGAFTLQQRPRDLDSALMTHLLTRCGLVLLLIASVALAHHESVITRNARHFTDIPGLTVHAVP